MLSLAVFVAVDVQPRLLGNWGTGPGREALVRFLSAERVSPSCVLRFMLLIVSVPVGAELPSMIY